jgi:hypothetical protein
MTDDEKTALVALLRHVTYSFNPINWNYDLLTEKEKELLSPEELALIKKMALELRE